MTLPLIWIGLTAAVSYLIVRSIYRLYFHPLRSFPGPKLAALTHAYEFYYDGVKGGQFIWEIQRMHEIYGPIVRINPRELHIKDPYYFDTIFTSRKQAKDPFMVRIFATPLSTAATVEHDFHRYRRELVNPFFSKRLVMNLGHVVQNKVDKNLKNEFRDAVGSAGHLCHVTRFFSIMTMIVNAAPGLVEWMQPKSKGLFEAKRMIEKMARSAIENSPKADRHGPKTIFDALCDKSVRPEERTIPRVRDEAMVVLGAGTETTARVLTTGSYHLYRDGPRLEKLRAELKTIMPEPTSQISLVQLEQLPYLTAVINESLRLAHTVMIRTPRISPTPLAYKDYIIPPGTPVSEIFYFMHMDPSIFPQPETFNPERWLEPSSTGERLTKFLVAFSKGSRNCVGMNLAYSELYHMFAALVRRFDLEIYNTPPESVHITRDFMIGLPESDAFKVYCLVTNAL
ncbi:cytochrome P450 [Aspergillus bertholletiae]|uniref:Cytochrome P450 n=1 Tax=Aspergillus bertholletiae TaxID=1226010 RepID=A0A5N7BF92_9EURO|nr:cytochrome P450 [Aspergillus bertholletiae]